MVLQNLFFESEINKAIHITERNYQGANFKAALQTALWDLDTARGKYKSFVGDELNMNFDLIYRFMEIQTIMLSPIAPHICEHIWSILGKEGLIVNARWPEAGEINEVLLKQNRFINDVLAAFRAKQTLAEKPKKNQKESIKSNSAVIYTSSSYPSWQRSVLNTIERLYQEKQQFPSDSDLLSQFKKDPILDKNEILANAMSFVAQLKETEKVKGIEAFQLTLGFNEQELLQSNLEFFVRSLKMTKASVESLHEGDERYSQFPKPPIPGSPVIHFFDSEGKRIQ